MSLLLLLGKKSSVTPTITVQPTNQATGTGIDYTFSLTATGSVPLSYQWQRAEAATPTTFVNIGTNSNQYTNTAVFPADDQAVFRCIVSNAVGNVTSNTVILTVLP